MNKTVSPHTQVCGDTGLDQVGCIGCGLHIIISGEIDTKDVVCDDVVLYF